MSRLPAAELLDLALATFAERGYEGTSVRDLCRRLGVSHNLVHERYGGKERLWYAAVGHGFEQLGISLAEAAVAVDDGDEVDRLRAILVRYVEATAQRPALIRIINQEAASPGPRLDHIMERFVGPAHAVADAVLRDLERAGRAHPVPPATLHFLIGHGAGGLVSLPALAAGFADPPVDPVAAARDAVDIVLRGIIIG